MPSRIIVFLLSCDSMERRLSRSGRPLLLLAHIITEKQLLVTEIQPPVGHHGRGPNGGQAAGRAAFARRRFFGYLEAAALLPLFWIGFEKHRRPRVGVQIQ